MSKGTIYICGMASEARIIGRDPNDLVIVSAGNRSALRIKLAAVTDPGAYGQVISFGVCGALNPVVRTGEQAESVVGSAQVISTAADRAAVFATTKADGVDNETDIAQAFALNAKLPFKTQRVILDEADQDLPPASLIPLKADGTPDGWAVALSVLRNPGQIPALILLFGQQVTAFETLRELRHA